MSSKTKYCFGTLYYEATRLCDLQCEGCMTGCNQPELVRESRKHELSADEIEHHVLKTARDIGIHTITWSGGEFLLRRDALDIIERTTRHGYASTVCTNGVKITPERLRELHRVGGNSLVVAVGINAITPENVETRDVECEVPMRVLEWCKQLGIKRHVIVTAGQYNAETLDTTFQWLEDRVIPYNRSPFTRRGSGIEHWDRMKIRKCDMEKYINPALRKHPLGYVSYTPLFLSPEVHHTFSKGAKNVTVPQNPPIGCWCGTWLGLNAEGHVAPCAILLDVLRCGNIREATFEQIIDESPDFQRVLDRNQLQGKCGRCRYKFTCGGCRAMALFETGDLMGEDPTCFFEPEDEHTICQHEEETNRNFKRFAFMVRQAERARTMTAEHATNPDPEQP